MGEMGNLWSPTWDKAPLILDNGESTEGSSQNCYGNGSQGQPSPMELGQVARSKEGVPVPPVGVGCSQPGTRSPRSHWCLQNRVAAHGCPGPTGMDGRWRAQTPTAVTPTPSQPALTPLSSLGQHPGPPFALPGEHCMSQPCQGTSHCPPHLSQKPLHLPASISWECLHPEAAFSTSLPGCWEPAASVRKSSSASPRFHQWINGSNARAPHGPNQREQGQSCPKAIAVPMALTCWAQPRSQLAPRGPGILGGLVLTAPSGLGHGCQGLWDAFLRWCHLNSLSEHGEEPEQAEQCFSPSSCPQNSPPFPQRSPLATVSLVLNQPLV